MTVQRRDFIVGGSVVLGASLFSLETACSQQASSPNTFSAWLRIGSDDAITVIIPHVDVGQGSHTALAQMLVDELDGDWSKVTTRQAPAEAEYANTAAVKATVATAVPGFLRGAANGLSGFAARRLSLQLTGGSSAISATGQYGMRTLGASVRLALRSVAASRMQVPASQLTTANGIVTHAATGRTLRYGELAGDASKLSLSGSPRLKARSEFKVIGQSPQRADIVAKVDGSAQYGIDFSLPNMRVATIMAPPVRGGTLTSVDKSPAMAITGVEQVLTIDHCVIVVAANYWQALKGLRALAPVFADGGHGQVSSASIYQDHNVLLTNARVKPQARRGADTASTRVLDVRYQVPYLHQATMEPLCLTGHHENGKIQVWGGTQDPLTTKSMIARASGLAAKNVTFHPMIMGGGFGRRFPGSLQIIGQIAKLAMQVPYPVKLIWSREEDFAQGAYRPQTSARLQGEVGADGMISSWSNQYAQPSEAQPEAAIFYAVSSVSTEHIAHTSIQPASAWRSVNHSQQGFFTESFMDEMAQLANIDPLEFRRKHLVGKPRHLAVLNDVAGRANWGAALQDGQGRGIAIVESFGTIVAHVIEASIDASGTPKVLRVWSTVDCGTTINPRNANAQIMGSIVMGLSAALGEAITLDKGAIVEKNYGDYRILKLAETPMIDIKFIESDGEIGGLGEPGLPPVAPALAGALFAASGKRYRQLPIISQA